MLIIFHAIEKHIKIDFRKDPKIEIETIFFSLYLYYLSRNCITIRITFRMNIDSVLTKL